MGGVPVLLMMAAVGITYGWQPDQRGGVEYVIQIPPEQLDELARAGELSSVIDAEVQGHVSRVIIRVGTGPLPRVSPANLGRSAPEDGAVIAASDQSPVPIPEMDVAAQAIPLPGRGARGLELASPAALMKPDTNGAAHATGGFGFPTQPAPPLPSLQGAADAAVNGLLQEVDQAGRDLTMRASEALARGAGIEATDPRGPIVPPPSTRTADPSRQTQAPPFTGTDLRSEAARSRAGGPSTDPVGPRDSAWRDFSAAGVSAAPPGGPSTEPVSPGQWPPGGLAADPRAATTNSAVSNPSLRGPNGLTTTDTFGKLPPALTVPAGNEFSTDRAAASASTAFAPPFTAASESTGVYPQSSTPGFADRPTAYSSPDPRLTAAQIAAGAWTYDAYGRPVDREGRLLPLDHLSSHVALQDPRSAAAAPMTPLPAQYPQRPSTSLGQPTTNPANSSTYPSGNYPGGNYPGGNFAASNYAAGSPAGSGFYPSGPYGDERAVAAGDMGSSNLARQPAQGSREALAREDARRDAGAAASGEFRADPTSLTSGRAASSASATPVASQPFFNTLLLLSFVVNVYLAFWLKNLRVQFHDLVAAKRMANSNSPAS